MAKTDPESQVAPKEITRLKWLLPPEEEHYTLEAVDGDGKPVKVKYYYTNWLCSGGVPESEFHYRITRGVKVIGTKLDASYFKVFCSGADFSTGGPEMGDCQTLKESLDLVKKIHCDNYSLNDDEVSSNANTVIKHAEEEFLDTLPVPRKSKTAGQPKKKSVK